MNLASLSPRALFAGVFAVCAGLIGFGLVLQHAMGLEPCPMCIMQRYAFILAGLIGLAAVLHDPGAAGRRVYAFLILAAALGGGGVAARQSWLQHNPPKIIDCGPDLGFMLEGFSLAEALPMIFRGTGDCSKVAWSFLGLSIAEWALVWFALLAAAAVLAWRRAAFR
jgi:disulfide bond formation protein DsbB